MGRKLKAAMPLVGIALFWNGIVGTFDGVIGHQLYRQYDARARYEPATARVSRSDVDARHSSDGNTYTARVEFSYEIGGVQYRSDRHSFYSFGTSDRDYAEAVSRRYPAGAQVTAYVDPDDPQEAVLDLSSQSFPATVLLFLAPFNLIGLGLIASIFAALRQPREKTEEEQLRERYVVVDTGEHVVIGKSRMRPGMVVYLSLLVSTFLANFAVFPFYGIGASLTVVAATLATCAGLSVAFAMWRAKKGRAPKNFLHVDRTRGTFSYPADLPGEPLDSIQSILHEPKSTGLSINNVAQFQHSFEAETPRGTVKLFEVRSSREEGDDVLELLYTELLKD